MIGTAKVALHDRDNAWIADLDVDSVEVSVNRDNACRRTATFACGSEYRDLLRVMGRRVKVYDVVSGPIEVESPTRISDTLVIAKAGVLSDVEGTIEVRFKYLSGTNNECIFDGNGPANKSLVVYIDTTGLPTLVYGDGTTEYTIVSTGNPLVNAASYAIAWNWSTSGITLLVDGDPVGFLGPFVQEVAVDMGSVYDAGTPAPILDLGDTVYLGGKADGTLQLIGDLYEVRISSRVRSATEILDTYESVLPVDEWTTLKFDFTGTVGAQAWVNTEIQIFDGYVDSVHPNRDWSKYDLQVSCRDKAKRYLLAGFEHDTTYEDLTASDVQRTISAVTASSSITAGSAIQRFGNVYQSELYATVLGKERKVVPSSVSGDILSGNYSTAYSETGLTRLRLSVGIDLRALEAVSAVTISANGTTSSIKTSQDGLMWMNYAGGMSFRYLRFDITRSSGPITAGVTVTTSVAYSPSNVTSDNTTSWRPLSSDLTRQITLDLESSLPCNVLYLRWGISSLDRASVFSYKIERSTDGSAWIEIGTYTSNASYLAEHLFQAASLRYLRITLLRAIDGLFALRYADLRLTTATVSADTVVNAIADSESETLFALTPTRLYTGATTFEAGAKKWDAMQKTLQCIGHELFYSRTGYLTSKPKDRYDLEEVAVFDDSFSLDIEESDDEVFNQVICVYESADVSLRSVQQDNDALSPTSIPNVGRRTAPVIKVALADTQAKLDAFALSELQRLSRRNVATSFQDIANPTLDAGDVIRIRDVETGVDGYYVLESFVLAYESDSKTMNCEVTPL